MHRSNSEQFTVHINVTGTTSLSFLWKPLRVTELPTLNVQLSSPTNGLWKVQHHHRVVSPRWHGVDQVISSTCILFYATFAQKYVGNWYRNQILGRFKTKGGNTIGDSIIILPFKPDTDLLTDPYITTTNRIQKILHVQTQSNITQLVNTTEICTSQQE